MSVNLSQSLAGLKHSPELLVEVEVEISNPIDLRRAGHKVRVVCNVEY